MPARRKIFYGWWMALASAILYLFSGGTFFYGFTTFFNPIRQTFGWTATATSVAFTFQRLESGLAGPIVGFLVDKVGPRKLMFVGWSVVGLGFLLMSRINFLWTFYGSFLIVTVGLSFGLFVPMQTAVANWFNKKRSRAMTLVYLGGGFSGLLVPLLPLSIGRFGWRETLVFIGIASWIIGIPLSSLMRHKPSQYGYLPDGETRAPIGEPVQALSIHSAGKTDSSAVGFTVKAALRTRAFWLFAAVFLLQHITTSALMVHIVPYLESVKVPTAIAATVVTGMTLSSLIGRISFGFLGDFTNKRYLIAIALALQTIGVFIFSFIDMDKAWLILPFLLIYGPGYGGPFPLRAPLQADYFGTKNFGTIMGLLSVVTMVGGLTSPVVAGWLFDTTGSYRFAWRLFALVTIPAIPLILLAKPPLANQEGHLT